MKKMLKTIVIYIALFVCVLAVLWIASERIESIENGDMTLVSEDYMNR